MEIWQDVVLFSVMGWLSLTNIQHGKKLAVIEKVLDGLVNKMDLFLKSEIDTLKELAKTKP
jgi:hypothetical protein